MRESMMASSARMMMMGRAAAGTLDRNATKFNFTMAQMNATFNNPSQTSLLIKKLVFAESKSVRTSTIILAVFNTLAALATASSIVYDCWAASKRCNPKFKSTYVLEAKKKDYVDWKQEILCAEYPSRRDLSINIDNWNCGARNRLRGRAGAGPPSALHRRMFSYSPIHVAWYV